MTDAILKAARNWNVTDLIPLTGSTCSEVVAGRLPDGREVVIKIPEARAEERQSIDTLRNFSHHGGVDILDYDSDLHAILMPRLTPGTTLDQDCLDDETALPVCAEAIRRLRHCRMSESAMTVREFYGDLDALPALEIVAAARVAFDRLEATQSREVLLHGDLHHGNILRDRDTWVVIDPKGLCGDPSFEVTAFMRNPLRPISADESRSRLLAFHRELGDPLDRLWGWSFVQTALSAGWTSPGGIGEHWFTTANGLWSLAKEFGPG